MNSNYSSQEKQWLKVGNFLVKMERNSKQAQSVLGLAPREITFLKLLSQGHSLKSMAKEMQISPHTVDTYKRRVYAKLGVNTAASAVLIAAAHYCGAAIELDQETETTLGMAA